MNLPLRQQGGRDEPRFRIGRVSADPRFGRASALSVPPFAGAINLG